MPINTVALFIRIYETIFIDTKSFWENGWVKEETPRESLKSIE